MDAGPDFVRGAHQPIVRPAGPVLPAPGLPQAPAALLALPAPTPAALPTPAPPVLAIQILASLAASIQRSLPQPTDPHLLPLQLPQSLADAGNDGHYSSRDVSTDTAAVDLLALLGVTCGLGRMPIPSDSSDEDETSDNEPGESQSQQLL